jgi:hypothetical protein
MVQVGKWKEGVTAMMIGLEMRGNEPKATADPLGPDGERE